MRQPLTMAVALVRQEQAAEADKRGERYSDLTSCIHVLFPSAFSPMNLVRHDRSLGLRETFVLGLRTLGEKQEHSKHKSGFSR
jgi:hypothetical protein